MKLAALVIVGVLLIGLICVGLWAYTPDKPRGDLEAKYKVAPADYLEISGVRIRLRDSGRERGPALILLHGFGSSLDTWDVWADELGKDFRVVRFDWPGMGLSGLDARNDYSDARSLAVLTALMDKLGITRASLVGNSMGGKLAWIFAARHPDKVEKLVLISPDGFASAGFEYGEKPKLPVAVRLLPYVLPTSLVRMSLSPAFSDPKAMTDALVERYRDMMLAPGARAAMVARMEQVMLDYPEPLLRRIQAPTLLLWGEKDGMIPFAGAADYVRLIPKAKLVALPGIGHVPQEEAPARSLKAVRAFLLAPDR